MTDIFSTLASGDITFLTYVFCTLAAFGCGTLVTVATTLTDKMMTKSFAVALVILPAIVETVIIMVNGNIGTGIAVAGAFSLVRFRSATGKARDIASIFLAMASGICCAAGYIWVALAFTAIVCGAIFVTSKIPFKSERMLDLRITVPETLGYHDAFNAEFEKYTKSCTLTGVRTCTMGSLYRLTYKVEMKDRSKSKEFIDALRCKNGNLEISLSETEYCNDEL